MRSDNRLGATMFVWGAFTIISVATITALVLSDATIDFLWGILLLVFFVVLLNGVFRATEVIWAGSPSEDSGKAKRTQPNRVRRLVESLSDDEVYELEAMLLHQQEQDEASRSGRS